MRFKLLVEKSTFDDSFLNLLKTSKDSKDRLEALRNLTHNDPQLNHINRLLGNKDDAGAIAIADSFYHAVNQSPKLQKLYVGYLLILSNKVLTKVDRTYFQNLTPFVNVLSNDKLKLQRNNKVLLDPALWKRSPVDFKYTLTVAATLENPNLIKSYFPEIENVSIDFLYNSKGELKPAGVTTKNSSTDTIFGTVNAWTKGQEVSHSGSSEKNSSPDGDGKESDVETYYNFERAVMAGENKPSKRIHINGTFVYDPSYDTKANNGWRPVRR